MFTRHQGWRGPRWPPRPRSFLNHGGVFSLFIEGIPRKASWLMLMKIFSRIGVVADFYISRKPRKNRVKLFGFVRYHHVLEAKQAVKNFNGMVVLGSKISVSMARYDKDGNPFTSSQWVVKKSMDVLRYDTRRCADAVLSEKSMPAKSVEEVPLSTKEPNNAVVSNKVHHVESVENAENTNKGLDGNVTGSDCIKDSGSLTLEITPLAAVVVDNTPVNCDSSGNKMNAKHIAVGSPQSFKGEATIDPLLKKSRRKPQNFEDIAKFLGYYTKAPLPAAQT